MGRHYPFGETTYKNYNPDNIEDIEDAIDLFEWLSDVNSGQGNPVASAIYEDCYTFLEENYTNLHSE